MSELIDRAVKHIDNIEALIKRLNRESVAAEGPPEASDSLQQVGRYGIEKGVVRRCEAAIAAILDVVRSNGSSIDVVVSSLPPKWWTDFRRGAEDQRLKIGRAASSLADALGILERHVSDDTPHLAALPLLIGNLHNKIITVPANYGFRAPDNPRTNRKSFHFELEIDNDIQPSVKKRVSKIIGPPKTCVTFLRNALREAEALV